MTDWLDPLDCVLCGVVFNCDGSCLPEPKPVVGVLPVEDDEQRLGWRTV